MTMSMIIRMTLYQAKVCWLCSRHKIPSLTPAAVIRGSSEEVQDEDEDAEYVHKNKVAVRI